MTDVDSCSQSAMVDFWLVVANIQNWSDVVLYEACKKWRREALEARRKFAGLLPEVYKRRLYEKHGYQSIYHFAAKLVGISHDQVDVELRLERRFSDKSALHEALVEGKMSVNKLARVASIVTVENQAELAAKIETLSQKAVEVFVQDYKNKNGLQRPLIEQKSLRAQGLELDDDVENQLIEMQNKGIDVNQLLRGFLQKRKAEIERVKEDVGEAQVRECEDRAVIGVPAKRYVPEAVRRVVVAEFGTKCAAEGCGRKAENLHHEKGFAKWGSHDPRFLKPLCKAHHELAHVGDERVQRFRGFTFFDLTGWWLLGRGEMW